MFEQKSKSNIGCLIVFEESGGIEEKEKHKIGEECKDAEVVLFVQFSSIRNSFHIVERIHKCQIYRENGHENDEPYAVCEEVADEGRRRRKRGVVDNIRHIFGRLFIVRGG